MAANKIPQANVRWVSGGYNGNAHLCYSTAYHGAETVLFMEQNVISIRHNDPEALAKVVGDLKDVGISVYGSMEAAILKGESL
ncbi:hypothetical protein [Vibrio phage V-YDF132]|nr:hypothetical protein [Vibrio phage V-YDF132]